MSKALNGIIIINPHPTNIIILLEVNRTPIFQFRSKHVHRLDIDYYIVK